MKYLKLVVILAYILLLPAPILATHNPSVSHSATGITNGTFSDNYTFISYAQNATPIVIRGNDTQLANLTVWQSFAGVPLASINATGSWRLGGGPPAAPLLFIDNNTQRVGIGTITPDSNLAVVGNASIDGSTFYVDAVKNRVGIGTITPDHALTISDRDSGTSNLTSISGTSSVFRIYQSNNRAILNFTSTAEHVVMILGAASPINHFPMINLERNGTTYGQISLSRLTLSDSLGNFTQSEMVVGSMLNSSFSLKTNNERRLVIDQNGSVGIGTARPSGELKLDVRGNIRTTKQLRAQAICDKVGANCKDIRATRWSRLTGDGTVSSFVKIANGTNGGPTLADEDRFGQRISSIGDLNGDGIEDIAVGALGDSTGGLNRGAVYIFFMNTNGTVASSKKIASGTGGGPTNLINADFFGSDVSNIGDLNGDGIEDIAVGAFLANNLGGIDRGEVYILFMKTDGTAGSLQQISFNIGGGPTLNDSDRFGTSVASIGDLNGDGVVDIAVGADLDDTGGLDRGAVYVLFMARSNIYFASQNVGIGTANPQAQLVVNSSTDQVVLRVVGPAGGMLRNLTEWYNDTRSPTVVAYINGTGSIFGQSKNFEITHPLNASRKLVHSSLEGPEQGIYYRGEAQLVNGTATILLPSYFEALAMKDSRTVQLTAKDGWSPLYVDGLVNGQFTVKTTPDGNKQQKFYWTVFARRGDIIVEK